MNNNCRINSVKIVYTFEMQIINCADSIIYCTAQVVDKILKASFDLQGQLEPSGLLAAVLPSGQQPNSSLSQDSRSSAVGKVVLKTAKPRGDTQGVKIFSRKIQKHKFCHD